MSCIWDWVVPGMYVAGCTRGKTKDDIRLWLPHKNQVDVAEFNFCPYCGEDIVRSDVRKVDS